MFWYISVFHFRSFPLPKFFFTITSRSSSFLIHLLLTYLHNRNHRQPQCPLLLLLFIHLNTEVRTVGQCRGCKSRSHTMIKTVGVRSMFLRHAATNLIARQAFSTSFIKFLVLPGAIPVRVSGRHAILGSGGVATWCFSLHKPRPVSGLIID